MRPLSGDIWFADMDTKGSDDLPTREFVHWCESCGREELLNSDDAYSAGWDFPPKMGAWGAISPRTCPRCAMKTTVWWTLAIEKRTINELTPQQLKVIGRILEEVPPGTETERQMPPRP